MGIDVEVVLGEMTLEEKAALVSGADLWHTVAIERLGVPALMCADGPHGLRAQVGEADAGAMSASVPATCFPTASALASTWDVALIREVGAAIGREARRWGVAVVLGPGVNIKRSPLCGRNFEYLSEDPFLAGELGLAMVEGIQSVGVGASVKHFAANNQEDDRLRVSADVDERTLREIYLPAFERIVNGGDPWTVMCAYNKVNGTYASEHHWLLTELLRDEWRWDGVVVSDWGACHDRVAALRAGLDWEMPPDLPRSPTAVVDAVRAGEIEESVLDRSARRMLALAARGASAAAARHADGAAGASGDPRDAAATAGTAGASGVTGNPLAAEAGSGAGDDGASETVDEAAHHDLARRAAAESIVLLKDQGGLLPLGEGSVAVIGELARTPRFQGAGSSRVNPTRVDVALDELRAALGAERVSFAPGYRLRSGDVSGDEELLADAVSTAAAADTVVLVIGLPAAQESEGFDRTHLELPDDQLRVLEAVVAANPDVVVALVNGSVVRIAHWVDRVPAVLEWWLGGQAAGGAIADVLTGRVDPAGRLAETIPVRLEDSPSFLSFPGDSGHVRYGEGVFVGYRGHDRLARPVTFPFGHGLSYTTFELDDLRVAPSGSVAEGDLEVAVEVAVTNTGARSGAHVVQVYVADPVASVTRPERELKGFAKVRLEPGQRAEVIVTLDQRALSFWSERLRRWVVEAGDFTIAVGSSSRDLPLAARITVDAPTTAPPLDGWSTLQEWLADPVGRRLLEARAGDVPWLRDRGAATLLATMPMRTLAAFAMGGFGHDELAALVEAWRREGVSPAPPGPTPT